MHAAGLHPRFLRLLPVVRQRMVQAVLGMGAKVPSTIAHVAKVRLVFPSRSAFLVPKLNSLGLEQSQMKKIIGISLGLCLSAGGFITTFAQETSDQIPPPPKVLVIQREYLKPGRSGSA